MTKTSKTVIVFEGNIIEVGFFQSLLEEAGIFCVIQDELMGTNFPWYVSAGGVGAVKLVVSQDDETKATALIDAYKSSKPNE